MNNPTVILETQRLILRHYTIGDLDSLFTFYSDPDVVKHIPDAPKTYEETKEELEWHMNGHPKFPELGLWATVHKATGDFIGRCGLLPWTLDGQNEVEVAFALSKSYWGQGLATEAAQGIVRYAYETLKLSRLVCLIEEGNIASVKVAEKIGMKFEKEGRDEIGQFLLYSMTSNMKQKIGAVSLLVRDYDEAILFYVDKLQFEVIEDIDMGGGKRWVTVAPPGSSETRLLLAKAASPEQESRIGDQTGGRVFLFLHTDDFWRDYNRMKENGVRLLEEPRNESYGTVVVFEDLYGNKWDLLEMKT